MRPKGLRQEMPDRPADVPEPETPPEFDPKKQLGREGEDPAG